MKYSHIFGTEIKIKVLNWFANIEIEVKYDNIN